MEKSFFARTTDTGSLKIAQYNEWEDFLDPNCRYLITLRKYEPGTSQAARGYYYNKVVPDFRKALYQQGTHLTKKDTEQFIRENCSPITIDETWNGERYIARVRRISELNDQELNLFIFDVKRYAAEHLHFFVADPNTI